MMDEKRHHERYTMTLLFTFMCGSLLTLLYLIPLLRTAELRDELPWLMIAMLLVLEAAMCGSLQALPGLPFGSLLFGAAAAYEAHLAAAEYAMQLDGTIRRTLLLMLTVPLHFFLCSAGMTSAAEARDAMSAAGIYTGKRRLHSYITMFTGAAAAVLLVWYIFT